MHRGFLYGTYIELIRISPASSNVRWLFLLCVG